MTNQELIEMAEKVYGKCDWHGDALAHLEQLAKLVIEHEREACAKICDEFYKGNPNINYSNTIAICIRGRTREK